MSRERASPRAVLLMKKTFNHSRLAVVQYFSVSDISPFLNPMETAMPRQVRLQTYPAHRQGDSSLQPKSRLVGRAFVVCAFSDISRPEHSQETPSQKIDQSVTQMIPDEERAVSVLRRHRTQSGNEERVLLPMSDT